MNSSVLFIFKKYGVTEADRYLTNDLVDSFKLLGRTADVLVLTGSDQDIEVVNADGVVLGRRMRLSTRYLKYPMEWFRIFKMVRDYESLRGLPDSIVMIGPLTPHFPFYFYFLVKARKSVCIVFDIFPRHQVLIKAVPAVLYKPLIYLERMLLRRVDLLTAMSPGNKEAIEAEYQVAEENVKVMSLWYGESGVVPDHYVTSRPFRSSGREVRFIFGGQVTVGRSLDFSLRFLERLRALGHNVRLSIYSSGDRFEALKSENQYDWVVYKNRLPRSEYVASLGSYDIGLVVTDPRVDLPTFPSKTIEYISSGLRVFAFLEKKSDLPEVLNVGNMLFSNRFSQEHSDIEDASMFLEKPYTLNMVDNVFKLRARFSPHCAAVRLAELLK